MKTVKLKDGRVVEVIDYEPRIHQEKLDKLIWDRMTTNKGPQFFVPVDHRRSGKSSGLVNTLIKICASIPGGGQAYYLYPQQKKIREHLWDNPNILPKFLPMSQVERKDDQRMVIYFKSGWQLIFDGTDENPDKHRGGNGKIYVVDEYDDQQKRVFSEIIRPVVEANKGICVLSGTPRGMKHLHEGYVAGQDPTRPQWWSRLLKADDSFDSDGNRLLTDAELKQIKHDYEADGIGPEFEQEYLCAFNTDSKAVFRKIDQILKDENGKTLEEQEPKEGRMYRIGCDPALTSDYWVNTVFDLHTNHEVYIERFQPMDSALGEARLEALARKYNDAEVYFDESGLGMVIASHLRDKGMNITPVKTAQMKERLITNMANKIDNMSIRLLPDKIATEELRQFAYNRLSTGKYQFMAPQGKHDDTVIARALAVWDMPTLTLKDKHWYDFFKEEDTKITNTYFGRKN